MNRRIWPVMVFALSTLAGAQALADSKAPDAVPALAEPSETATKEVARASKLASEANQKKILAAKKTFAVRTLDALDQAGIIAAGKSELAGVDLSKMPIEDAVMLMFMMISDDARKDLKDMLTSMDDTRKKRAAMRAVEKKLRDDGAKEGTKAPAPTWLKSIKETKSANFALPYPVLPVAPGTDCEFKGSTAAITLDGCLDEMTQKDAALGTLADKQTVTMKTLSARHAKIVSALEKLATKK
jgi:hypothetical protein